MPSNPQHEWALTVLDFDNETSSMGGFMGPITVGTIAGFLTQFGALKTAVSAIILGNIVRDRWTGDVTRFNVTPPTDENAQRERKALVRYMDTTNFATYRMEIPTIDLVGRLLPGTDQIDLTETDVAAFVTAFEAIARSPDGNAVNVLDIHAVGRST